MRLLSRNRCGGAVQRGAAMRAEEVSSQYVRELVILRAEGLPNRIRVDGGDMIGFAERVASDLPVTVEMCLDGDWVVGIFVLNALEIVSHAAKELLEADRRVALQVDDDEAFPDLGRDRREAALRIVEPLERSLVGHADQTPVSRSEERREGEESGSP